MVNQVLWANNDSATLAASITNSQTTITLTSGEGSLFPSPGAGQFFSVTLVSAANASNFEIVYCTARSGDSLTVQRAREGTTGLAFNAGDIAAGYLTAGQMALLPQLGQTQTWTGANTFTATVTLNNGADANGYDAGGANFRAVAGSYGVLLRSDGTNFYLLTTSSGNQYGIYNSFRPFSFNLSTGAVTIDATGAGVSTGGNLTTDGVLTVNGYAQLNNNADVAGTLQVNSALTVLGSAGVNGNFSVGGAATVGTGARGSGNVNRVVILGDYSTVASGANLVIVEMPDGIIDQTTNQGVPYVDGSTTTTLVTLPTTYPTNILDAICSFDGTSPDPNVTVSCQPYNPSQVVVAVAAQPGAGSAIAGVVIRSRGF